MTAFVACLACVSLLAKTNEPVYLGIDAKGVRHESKESAGKAPWMHDVAFARAPRPLFGDRTRWYEGVGIFRLRIDPTTGATREITIVRSTGLIPVSRPIRRGPNYIVIATDRSGGQVRVLVDAHYGDVRRIHPVMAPYPNAWAAAATSSQ